MTVYYRVFDVHEPAGNAVAEGSVEFRPVVGDKIYVDDYVYTVEECRMRHEKQRDQGYLSIRKLDLMCVRSSSGTVYTRSPT